MNGLLAEHENRRSISKISGYLGQIDPWCNKRLKQFIILLFFIFAGIDSFGQVEKSHYLGFSTQYSQIKEGANYGLVNQGGNLSFAYRLIKKTKNRQLTFAPDFSFGANYRNGIGMSWHFNLIDLRYTYNICKKATRSLNVGPYFASNHFYQLYPELQSGHMFWLTSIELGPVLEWNLTPDNRLIEISGLISILALNSRKEQLREEYYYSLNVSDILSESHSNMKVNSLNNYLHLSLSARTNITQAKRMKVGYKLELIKYSTQVPFSYLTHSIELSWQLGK